MNVVQGDATLYWKNAKPKGNGQPTWPSLGLVVQNGIKRRLLPMKIRGHIQPSVISMELVLVPQRILQITPNI